MTKVSYAALLAAVALLFCGTPLDPTQQIQQIEGAIATIEQNPTNWLIQAQQLQQSFTNNGSALAAQVGQIIQQGQAAMGNQVRCTVDFTGNRVAEALQVMLAQLKGQPAPMFPPYVCTVNYVNVNLGSVPAVLSYSGYNFGPGLKAVVTDHAGATHDITANMSIASAYSLAINLSQNAPVQVDCTWQTLALVWGNGSIQNQQGQASAIPFTLPTTCPQGPPPLPPKACGVPPNNPYGPVQVGPNLGGVSQDYPVGCSPCDPGYVASQQGCQIQPPSNIGPNDPVGCYVKTFTPGSTDCSCTVHCGAKSMQSKSFTFTVSEVGAPQPAPPCGCTSPPGQGPIWGP
jgi:hypothetical protein